MNDNLNNNSLIRLSILAEKTGLSVHCIRTYVDQSLIQVSDRTSGGLLLFDETAIQRLRFIKTARDAGVPLAKIVCLLAASDKGNAEETNTRMAELNQFIGDTRNKVSEFEQSLLTFERVMTLQ
jgi:MerR family mercuric resistance operon transcriptional regulator